jgi:hypothetical protein
MPLFPEWRAVNTEVNFPEAPLLQEMSSLSNELPLGPIFSE